MKRYEQMTKEEIIEAIRGAKACQTCQALKMCEKREIESCCETVAEYLKTEIEVVPRVAKINTLKELDEALEEWRKKDDSGVFSSYLAEAVEK